MNSRDNILNRLRQVIFEKKDIVLPEVKDSVIFKNIVNSRTELINLFTAKIEELKGEVYKTGSVSEAVSCLKNVFSGLSVQSVLVQSAPLINKVLEEGSELKKFIDQTARFSISSIPFADYQASITVADYLIARTGSIILNCRSAAGRRLSVLPPIHIVIAETDQIIPSLDNALALIKEKHQLYSYMTIITGASRTSDIEKQLILGAHGPKRLVVILLDR